MIYMRPIAAGCMECLLIATKCRFIKGGPGYANFGVLGNREYLRG